VVDAVLAEIVQRYETVQDFKTRAMLTLPLGKTSNRWGSGLRIYQISLTDCCKLA